MKTNLLKFKNLMFFGVIIFGILSIIASDGNGEGNDDNSSNPPNDTNTPTSVTLVLRMEFPTTPIAELGRVGWEGELISATGTVGIEEFQDNEDYGSSNSIGFNSEDPPQAIHQVNFQKVNLKKGTWKFRFIRAGWLSECEVQLESPKSVNFYAGREGCGEDFNFPSE